MSNRLAGEKSPYLLQHAENPVEWYPWGEEAFRKARSEDKPIFLSIGYSTCHWCHVMEHESFEDEEVAAVLNRNFVSIKVDREERPDIDQVYMTACQAATGSGGWPLSIFMGPDRKPFYAGTYFPKQSRMGRPGFVEVAERIAELWAGERDHLGGVSEKLSRAMESGGGEHAAELPGRDLTETAYKGLSKTFDPVHGGFGAAPKFPTAHNLSFLTRWHGRNPDSNGLQMVEKTLLAMRSGGIFDQIGFGFHRYSVDEKWIEPHFEKMLYDQAMLALAYTDAYLATGKARYGAVAGEIFEYAMRDMLGPEGGFHSAQDADSEGKEGVFYTWTPEQVAKILGKDEAGVFCRAYGVTSRGNFHGGASILNIAAPFEKLAADLGMDLHELERLLEDGRLRLFEEREKRVHPFKDDKILAAWNGLMIAALARGAQALGESLYAGAAVGAANFVLREMQNDAGRIYRRYRRGEVANPGYADDYAFLIWGLIELYETVFDVAWLAQAVRLQEEMTRIFGAPDGGFYFCGNDTEQMIVKERPLYDAALPSGNSVAAMNLLRLGRMTGDPQFEKQADLLMRSFAREVSKYPAAYTQFLQALDFAHGPTREIIVAGDLSSPKTKEMIDCVWRAHSPNRVLLVKESGTPGDELAKIAPFSASIVPESAPAAYVCQGYSCQNPARSVSELRAILQGADQPMA
ncbi:MAG: thioredoxin domain-containing protein [Syntrophobacteraceae bacterium]|nr:thioredoxin domain-containing protein [Syntrophobacteraceae bacterium]